MKLQDTRIEVTLSTMEIFELLMNQKLSKEEIKYMRKKLKGKQNG